MHGGGTVASGCALHPGFANDGCSGANVNGNFQASTFFTCTTVNASCALQTSQTYSSSHPPAWNVACVDYKCGYDTTLTLKDPASATLPSGCTYAAGGHAGYAFPSVNCVPGANAVIDFEGFDMSLHNCTQLFIASNANTTQTLTIKNNNWVNGSGCSGGTVGVNANFILIQSGVHVVTQTITNNMFDGQYPTFSNVQAIGDSSAGTSSTTCSKTFKYNVFINIPANPGAGANGWCNVLHEYNYYGNFNAANLTHGAVYGLIPTGGTQPSPVHVYSQNYSYNTCLYGSAIAAGSGSTCFSFLTNGASFGIYATATVDHNVTVSNQNSGSAINSVAITFIDHAFSIGNVVWTNNYTDPTGGIEPLF